MFFLNVDTLIVLIPTNITFSPSLGLESFVLNTNAIISMMNGIKKLSLFMDYGPHQGLREGMILIQFIIATKMLWNAKKVISWDSTITS